MRDSTSFYSLYYDEEVLAGLDQGRAPRGDAELIRRLKKQVGRLRVETVVDVGCGNGGHTFGLAEAFPKARIAGVDPYLPGLEEAVEARSKEDEDRIFFLPGSLENLPFEDDSTDLLWSFDTFCHAPKPEAALGECARVVVPEGLFALTSPFCTPLMDTVTWKQLRPIGISRKAMDVGAIERYFPGAGLEVIDQDNYSSEFLESIERNEPGRVNGDVLRLTRLIREREKWETRWGKEKLSNLIALVTFNIAILTGKIDYHVWIFRKKKIR